MSEEGLGDGEYTHSIAALWVVGMVTCILLWSPFSTPDFQDHLSNMWQAYPKSQILISLEPTKHTDSQICQYPLKTAN